MRSTTSLGIGALATLAVSVGCASEPELASTEELLRKNSFLPNGLPIHDSTGYFTTVNSNGHQIDVSGAFFQNIGANGRRCVSCHLPTAGWTITPEQVQAIFDATDGGAIEEGFGLGAMFRTNDGSNSPDADVSTLEARREAYSMMLTKGLIRVSMPVPANAEFELIDVQDPYGHSSAADLSMFRRPLPSTNLRFLSTIMWDGRETQAIIRDGLLQQANDATQGHAARPDPISQAQREDIVNFELGLHTAQVYDDKAGPLNTLGALGGPDALIQQVFYVGINDNFGDSRTGAAFTPIVFTLYQAWASLSGSGRNNRRAAIARGEVLFNTKNIDIAGVSGINDEEIFGTPAVVHGTCTTCHDTPNSGNHSVVAPLDIGLVAESERTPDMPLYTFRLKGTTQTKTVTDPGRAMISGKWKHIGRFKGPILRGLSARAPYFHNGSAATLADAVEFYNRRFGIGLTPQEKSDLAAFLSAL